ncbi:MAG: hypothetical protein Ct9H300mP27_03680 [Chloroflexota bacterium]|nr:MAG: hypothetical protein Ct9H300mP27_03680 [Chloroflexota bacterium]
MSVTLQINMWFDYTCPHSHLGVTLTKVWAPKKLGCVINTYPPIEALCPCPEFVPIDSGDVIQSPLGNPSSPVTKP